MGQGLPTSGSIMELLLWRHAEAAPGMPDEARPLTDAGLLHAQQMADWLRTRLPFDLLILSSPAVRARQTAEALNLPFTVSDALAKHSSATSMRDAAGWPDNARNVMLVGHQPGLGELLVLLLGAATPLDDMPKAGIWWLTSRSDGGRLMTGVRAVIGPASLGVDGP
jgi:phosphohistidine phosphatase